MVMMGGQPFGARLSAALREQGPLCAGIDPSPALLHAWGVGDTPAGLATFSSTVAEAAAGVVGVAKPQAAFYERHGSRGIAVLERTIATLRAAGTLVVLDAKRGDMGSTSTAYAEAYLDPAGPLAVDAITASPFLGMESLQPMVDTALRHGNGMFVLARTSNPDGATVQLARAESGGTVADLVLRGVSAVNDGVRPLGSIGVVVGATVDHLDHHALEQLNGPLLVPGVGAQGATFADVRRRLGQVGDRAVVPVSRSLLEAGPEGLGERLATLSADCREQLGTP